MLKVKLEKLQMCNDILTTKWPRFQEEEQKEQVDHLDRSQDFSQTLQYQYNARSQTNRNHYQMKLQDYILHKYDHQMRIAK